jgi:hypothetical protein|tara:strand:+ start:615 stop:1028 length:414 start_codon:yes stop_codon:yes gene_type:complete
VPGAKRTLVLKTIHSETINDLIWEMRSEYGEFVKANKALSGGNYPKFLEHMNTEFGFLEEAGEEIRGLESRLIGKLKSVKSKLNGHKKQLGKHDNSKKLIDQIDKFLRVIKQIEKAIRIGATSAIDQEGILKGLTKK